MTLRHRGMTVYVKQEKFSVDNVHLVGVAGTGLRGLAGILSQKGLQVSGSDAVAGPVVDFLRQHGVSCSIGHRRENVSAETKLVLVSAAVQLDNPELEAARQRGIPILKYAEFLGLLMKERAGVALAGTHGKTTTTAMTAQILLETGRDPSFIIGGDYPRVGGSARWGHGRHFVAEACEFDRSFLNLFPEYAVVTNLEEEHLDYFHSLAEIQEAFGEFVSHLPAGGFLVLNGDDPNSAPLRRHARCDVGLFSLEPGSGDWWSERIRPGANGVEFVAVRRTGERMPLRLQVPGIHNVKNALAVTVLLDRLGVPLPALARSLEAFTGVRRRFEVLLREPGVVIDDYAHHPTEIEMVLRASREMFAGRRVRVIFQPHQYSRTYRFRADFARALSLADDVIITEVFAARDTEEDRVRIDARRLAEAVTRQGGTASHAETFDDVIECVAETFKSGDVLLCLGAGDITYLASRLAETICGLEDVCATAGT